MGPAPQRRAAVVGHPVEHSLSPVLHRAAYDQLGLTRWRYGRQDVTPEDLAGVLAGLDATWAGLSVTMPLKQTALELVDLADSLATVTGSVNTVLVNPGRGGARGLVVGMNTDVHGIVQALRESAPTGWAPTRAVVLGARATASSALAALAELGITHSVLAARSVHGPGSAALAADRMGVRVEHLPWADATSVAHAVAGADVVISTVPAGVADELAAVLRGRADDGRPGPDQVLLDVAYHPWPSALVAAWQDAGGAVTPGWAMLLHQAEAQVRLMTGRTPDVEVMRAALLGELERRAAVDAS